MRWSDFESLARLAGRLLRDNTSATKTAAIRTTSQAPTARPAAGTGQPAADFDGLPEKTLPTQWLDAQTQVRGTGQLWLGPEPLIPPQSVTLTLRDSTSPPLRVATDGLRPFAVQSLP